jgi:hypothetical protein
MNLRALHTLLLFALGSQRTLLICFDTDEHNCWPEELSWAAILPPTPISHPFMRSTCSSNALAWAYSKETLLAAHPNILSMARALLAPETFVVADKRFNAFSTTPNIAVIPSSKDDEVASETNSLPLAAREPLHAPSRSLKIEATAASQSAVPVLFIDPGLALLKSRMHWAQKSLFRRLNSTT